VPAEAEICRRFNAEALAVWTANAAALSSLQQRRAAGGRHIKPDASCEKVTVFFKCVEMIGAFWVVWSKAQTRRDTLQGASF
jgi:hypothetical protein